MRVSKTVRDYIEEQVASKFPKTENELQYEQNEQVADTMNKEYCVEIEKAKASIVASLCEKYGVTDDTVVARMNYGNVFSTFHTKARDRAELDRQARQKAINKKINDIIVSLELGGTKADLERMLAEI